MVEDEQREAKRRKLNDDDGGSRSISSCSSDGSSAVIEGLIDGLPNEMSQIVKFMRKENEEREERLRMEMRRESVKREEEIKRDFAREIEELRRENNLLKKIDRNEKHLNSPLAYKRITAFEMWREILMFV